MEPDSIRSQRLRRVEKAFASLPDRYLGCDGQRQAIVEIRLSDLGRTWEIELRPERCKVRTSPCREPDVVIGTDAGTWLAMRQGRLSGLDAFSQRRLWARGDLDLAVHFEGLFRLPDGRPPLLRLHDMRVRGARISCLTAGHGAQHAVLIHGLGAAKSMFYETVAALSPDYTVHAIDLPGFGASSKPLGSYGAGFLAAYVLDLIDALGIERAHLIGHSMGGRVALEVGMHAPSRVCTLTLLSPSMAFRRRRAWVPLVRILRPEMAVLPHMLRPDQARESFRRQMFAQPERIDPAVADIAADEFVRAHSSRAARVAFYAAARQIYIETPDGPAGFWTRLAHLRPPALFVWGSEDRLVPHHFSRHVAEVLPEAPQVVLAGCGHVPQIELPERTHSLIRDFIASAAAEPRSSLRLAQSA